MQNIKTDTYVLLLCDKVHYDICSIPHCYVNPQIANCLKTLILPFATVTSAHDESHTVSTNIGYITDIFTPRLVKGD